MRKMLCAACHQVVAVYEIPPAHLDPDSYTCGLCLESGKKVKKAVPLRLADAPEQTSLFGDTDP